MYSASISLAEVESPMYTTELHDVRVGSRLRTRTFAGWLRSGVSARTCFTRPAVLVRSPAEAAGSIPLRPRAHTSSATAAALESASACRRAAKRPAPARALFHRRPSAPRRIGSSTYLHDSAEIRKVSVTASAAQAGSNVLEAGRRST